MADLARRVVQTLAERYGSDLVAAVLFGSVARGEAGLGSDVDLILVFRTPPAGRQPRFRLFYDALMVHRAALDEAVRQGIGIDWSPVILSAAEASEPSPLYLDLVDDAVLLVDRDGFFAGVLQRLRSRLAEMGATRIRLPDGSWYWDLNPQRLPATEVRL
jgi:predicted nucleotidyltransferase